jgi:ubiquinone/menaquinone biosynthesis C-methylase UbiE
VRLYVRQGARVLDTTYGRGRFWKQCDLTQFDLVTADLELPAQVKCDFRHLPFPDAAFDHSVFDPPYVHCGRSTILRDRYNNGVTTGTMNHNRIIAMYKEGMRECARVTKGDGLIWVKCQDEIEHCCQRLSMCEVTLLGLSQGICVRDTYVLHPASKPVFQARRQQHARKNHSYLVVFEKAAASKWKRQTAVISEIIARWPRH